MDIRELKARFDSDAFEQEYHTNEPLGSFGSEAGTRFALWAPTAERVTLKLYSDCFTWEPLAWIEMQRGERGVWYYETARNLDGTYYDFDVVVDGVMRTAGDPYAKACGANGWRSMVVDLARTNPPGWERDRAPARQAEDIIYEIHVKDFTWDPAGGVPDMYRGKFKALTLDGMSIGGRGRRPTGLAYLKKLGVTHVELMPVYDYGSVDELGGNDQFNWGYDPVNYNVPEGSYATDPCRGEVRIRELKEAVQAMHRAGLRVIMDVVYNHTYRLDSHLFRTVPWYYVRQREDGSASNGSGCGSEIATERSMVGRYIFDSVMYWAEEYHIDGFRFDLMGLIDAELITGIRRALDKKYGEGEKLVFGEPWSGGSSAERIGTALCHKGNLKALPMGVGAFSDDVRDAVKGSVFDAKSRGFANGGGLDATRLARCVRGFAGAEAEYPFRAPSQTISYLSSHDDWTLWDKLVLTLHGDRRYVPLRKDVVRANKLAAAMLFCCQGRVFMLSGEEFGRTKLGVKNSYRSPYRINRFDWKRAYQNKALVSYYRGLIALRKQLPALCDKSERAHLRLLEARDVGLNAAVIRMDNTGGSSAYREILLCFNASDAPCAVRLEGEWEILADHENSFAYMHPTATSGEISIPPVSALILGRQ